MNIIDTFHLDWPNLIVGFVLGAIAAYAAHALYDRVQTYPRSSLVRKKYGKVGGLAHLCLFA